MKPKNSPLPESASPPRLLASYGRRRGRPLRTARQHLVDTLLPRISVVPPLSGQPLDLAVLIPQAREAWLEIGFGGGEHLAAQAVLHPQVGMIGCEPYVNGMASLLAKLDADAVGNVRIHAGDARPLIDALPDAALSRVFILYPDPWPKLRHHKRRLINAALLQSLARVMRAGALLRLATDDADYAQWMLEHLLACPYFQWLARQPEDWRNAPADWVPTRYEAKAKAAGRTPAYLDFVRL